MSSLNGDEDLSPTFINPKSTNTNVTDVNGLITLQQLNNTVGIENNFDRTGTILTPHVSGDSLAMGSGDLTIDTVSQKTSNINNDVPGIYGGYPTVTDNGDGTVDIDSCTVILKATTVDSPKSYTIAAITNQALTDLSINYVIVDYNAGAPIYSISTAPSTVNYINVIAIGQIYRSGTVLITSMQGINANSVVTNLQALQIRKFGLTDAQGMYMSTPGSTKFASTLGLLYFGTNVTTVPAIDTNVTGTVKTLWRVGTTWTATVNANWDSSNYNQTASALTAMTTDYYNFYDVYYLLGYGYYLVMGQNQYLTDLLAATADMLTTVPPSIGINKMSIYCGRFTFKANTTVAVTIISAFPNIVNTSRYNSHSGLRDLNVDLHPQYAKVTSRSSTRQDFGTLVTTFGSPTTTVATSALLQMKGVSTGSTISIQYPGNDYPSRDILSIGANTDDSFGCRYVHGTGWISSLNNTGCVVFEHNGTTGVMSILTGKAVTGGLINSWSHSMKFDATNNTILVPVAYSTGLGGTKRDLFVSDTGVLGYDTSLREHKMNIVDLVESWVYNLRPVTFNRRKMVNGIYTNEPDNIEYGLIADEVELVNDKICYYDDLNAPSGKDRLKNEDGTYKDPEWKLAGVQYSQLISPMLKCIQEQKKKIDTYEIRITQLEQLVSELIETYNNHVHVTDNVISGKPTIIPQ